MLNYVFATNSCSTSLSICSGNFSTWIALIGILGGLMLILISAFIHVFYSQRKMKKLEMIKFKKTKAKKSKKIKLAKTKVKKKK